MIYVMAPGLNNSQKQKPPQVIRSIRTLAKYTASSQDLNAGAHPIQGKYITIKLVFMDLIQYKEN